MWAIILLPSQLLSCLCRPSGLLRHLVTCYHQPIAQLSSTWQIDGTRYNEMWRDTITNKPSAPLSMSNNQQPPLVIGQGANLATDETPPAPLSNNQQIMQFASWSACLLLKDNNIILPEWLAYHYTVLPLRRLIVAVDPSSKTRSI